ncbi:thioesterase II family protein [Cohnella suwonensis]|uniref:Thioesterase II family protein n=1 Tax=Cohnella suwonensis TaxID=696072 RepID=A0ABW0LSY2_9BACL
MKLFCLPYAGASAAIYMKWNKAIAPGAACFPLELAGRGVRSGDPFYRGMEEAAEDVLERLMRHYDGTPYAVFGHSMGGMILYEVCRLLRERNLPPPAALFFSGRPAPDVSRTEEPIHLLPDDEFAERILEMGATSAEVFSSKPLMDVFMPILRADFRLVETYRYEEKEPLPWRLTILAGRDEKWTDEELEGWSRHTTAECRFVRMQGGHFYWQNGSDDLQVFLQNELSAAPRIEMNFVKGGR